MSSSLTSIGINKNKKGFAPKVGKRNVRKVTKEDPKNKATTSKPVDKPAEKPAEPIISQAVPASNIAAVKPPQISNATQIIAGNSSSSSSPANHITVNGGAPKKIATVSKKPVISVPKKTAVSILKKTVAAPTAAMSMNDTSGLTQEEIDMNMMAATRRALMEEANALNRNTVVDKEPTLYRSDCAVENNGIPALKFEQSPSPMVRRTRRNSISQPLKKDDDEAYDHKERLASPKVDIESLDPPSPEADDSVPPSITSSRSESASTTPAPTIIRATRRNKGKGKATDTDFFAPRTKSKTPVVQSSTKSRTTRNARGVGSSTSKSSSIGIPTVNKAVSISIGAPSAAQSEDEEDEEDEEEDYDADKFLRPARRGRKAGPRLLREKSDRFAYRLPENLKTLEDINKDPANPDNLDKSMATFTKDIDGIVSKIFKEQELARHNAKRKLDAASKMTPQELAEMKAKEKEEEELAAKRRKIAQEKEEERRRKEADSSVLAESSNALQVRLINGQIVLDTDTLTVERTEAERDYGDGALEVVEESATSRKVNSGTYGKRQSSARWNALETDQFYDCISQFGTDFEMISMVMPGRSRNQIRTKFNREERVNADKVTEYLIRKRKPLDLAKYEEAAGKELLAVPDEFHEMQLA